MKKFKSDILLSEEAKKYEIYCKVCGWKNHMYPINKKGRILCKNCNNYIFRNNEAEFKYKLKEVMNKCKSSN